MKNTHLYKRLGNHTALCGYVNKIMHSDIQIAKFLVGNISVEADDHPKYPLILHAYQKRLQHEQNKKE